MVKSKKTFRSQAIVNQNAETELMLEGDDDAVSLLQEKEIDNLAGKYFFFLLCCSTIPSSKFKIYLVVDTGSNVPNYLNADTLISSLVLNKSLFS